MKFKSSNQYLRFPVRVVSRDPQQTRRLQTAESYRAETCIWHLLWHWWNYGKWQQTPRERGVVPGVMHLSAAGQTPFPPSLEFSSWHSLSWQGLIKITLIYLCTLPGITCELKKRTFLEKTDRHHPGIVTLSFWAMRNHLRVACCNWIVFVSYNMLNSLKRMSIEKQDIDWWVSDCAINHSKIIQLLTLDIYLDRTIWKSMLRSPNFRKINDHWMIWIFGRVTVQSWDLIRGCVYADVTYLVSFMWMYVNRSYNKLLMVKGGTAAQRLADTFVLAHCALCESGGEPTVA